MERWAAKLVAVFALFVVVFTSTLLPIKVSDLVLRQGRRGEVVISCMMCFGGGVFLSAYTLHMAPGAREIIDEAVSRPLEIEYPLADLIMICGFFMMLGLDTVVHRYNATKQREQRARDAEESGRGTLHMTAESKIPSNGNINNCARKSRHPDADEVEPLFVGRRVDKTCCHDCAAANIGKSTATKTADEGCDVIVLSCTSRSPCIVVSEAPEVDQAASDGSSEPEQDAKTVTFALGDSMDGYRCNSQISDAHVQQLDKADWNNNSEEKNHLDNEATVVMETVMEQVPEADQHHATRSLILLFALSMDHVFEGLSIGLKERVSDVLNLCIAILAHEIVIAFSVGMQMVRVYKKTSRVVIAASVCSGMMAIGVVFGIVMTDAGHYQNLSVLIANGILQSLATGVFIYVTFFEILQPELGAQDDTPSFVKLFFALAGFVCLALLLLVKGDATADTDDVLSTQAPAFNFTL